MAPPSQLAIATKAVDRLVREQASYRRELAEQQRRADKLEADLVAGRRGDEDDEGNAEFMVKQHRQAVEETKAVFGPLRKKIESAVETLESRASEAEAEAGAGGEEVVAARAVLEKARAALAQEGEHEGEEKRE